MKAAFGFFVILYCLSAYAESNPVSTVTIPIQEYLDLKKTNEKPSVTTVEEIKITGEFRKKLEITFTGASVGVPSLVDVLQGGGGYSLNDCNGNGLLKSSDDKMELLPRGDRYIITCQIIPKSWGEFSLTTLSALFLKVDVKGIEPVVVDQGSSIRKISFQAAISQRQIATDTVEPSLVGRYHITVLPEDTKFDYWLFFNNPNRATKNFSVSLANNEVVQKIITQNSYEDKNGTVVFKLASGESTIRIMGRLPGNDFKPITNKGLSYLLIDNHPLLSLDLKAQSRRIAVSDTGMAAVYNGGRAFLLEKIEPVSWVTKKLEVFPALSYTVNHTQYEYYWAKEGSSLVEATFSFANTGTPEIPLLIPGTATYLEINGVPQVLSKDDKNQLVLRVPNGPSNVLVQYQTVKTAGRTLASLSDQLARPEGIMSNVDVNVKVPVEQNFLYARGLGDSLWKFNFEKFLLGLATFFMSYLIFRMINFSNKTRIVLGLAVGFFVYTQGLFLVVFISSIIFLIFHFWQKITSLTPKTWKGWLSISSFTILTFVLVKIAVPFYTYSADSNKSENGGESYAAAPGSAGGGSYARGSGSMAVKKSKARTGALLGAFGSSGLQAKASAAMDSAAAGVESDLEPAGQAEEPVGTSGDAAVADNYQGLPSKIEMPKEGYAVHFHSGLMDKVTALKVQIISVPFYWLRILNWLIFFIFLGLLWRNRLKFQAYFSLHFQKGMRSS